MNTRAEYLEKYYTKKIEELTKLNNFANDNVRQWRDNKVKDFKERLSDLSKDKTRVFVADFVNKHKQRKTFIGFIENELENNEIDFRVIYSNNAYEIDFLYLLSRKDLVKEIK